MCELSSNTVLIIDWQCYVFLPCGEYFIQAFFFREPCGSLFVVIIASIKAGNSSYDVFNFRNEWTLVLELRVLGSNAVIMAPGCKLNRKRH